jgi:hypothetical protein
MPMRSDFLEGIVYVILGGGQRFQSVKCCAAKSWGGTWSAWGGVWVSEMWAAGPWRAGVSPVAIDALIPFKRRPIQGSGCSLHMQLEYASCRLCFRSTVLQLNVLYSTRSTHYALLNAQMQSSFASTMPVSNNWHIPSSQSYQRLPSPPAIHRSSIHSRIGFHRRQVCSPVLPIKNPLSPGQPNSGDGVRSP